MTKSVHIYIIKIMFWHEITSEVPTFASTIFDLASCDHVHVL
jgi:hypothetical protein